MLRIALTGLLACALAVLFGSRAGERAHGEPITVAFSGPVSGSSAEDGLSGVRAIELVFDEVNAAGGIGGRPLLLRVYDDANDAALARDNAPTIAGDSDIVAVIGHNYSACSIAAGRIYAERGIPAITSASTNVAVTEGNDWYFRTIYNDLGQGQLIALYAREVLSARNVAVIHEDQTYGGFLGKVVASTADRLGLEVAGVWHFDASAPDVSDRLATITGEVLDRWRAGRVDTVILTMQPEAGVAIVERLRDQRFTGKIVVSDALASQAFVDGFRELPAERLHPGFYTEGIYASTPFLFDTGGRNAAAFLRRYVARYDRAPDWYAAFAADAATVLVAAMRRVSFDPAAATIAADRKHLRDALASIHKEDAVAGVTGPVWFDAIGDAEKPVPMGRFTAGQIVSAFSQLRFLAGVASVDDADPLLDPVRVVSFDGRVLYRTDVVRVGVLTRRFGDVDFAAGTFQLDFDLWFRHEGSASVEDLVFTNSVEPVSLGDPVEEIERGDLRYRLYRSSGKFFADTLDAGYGEHAMALSFRHRDRTRDDLILAIDSVGMDLGRERTRTQRTARARELLGANSPWTVDDVTFFESEVDAPTLGNPDYLRDGRTARQFSLLTVGAFVSPKSLSLRRSIPATYERGLLALAIVVTGVLLYGPTRRFLMLRWLLQAAAAILLLIVAEPVLGNALRGTAGLYYTDRLARAFEVLWWLVPAILIDAAVTRFVWRPAEQRTGNSVPTILRYFISFLIYTLAAFGIIAFVYDYRLTGLLATSGVLAMIIGLAVQLNITNIFAGVALNLERPFRIGDWILIHGGSPDPDDGVIGRVVDINWRTTRLVTADDTEIVIPNGVISEKTITNFMSPQEMSRFELSFTVDQRVAPERVIAVMTEALRSVVGADKEGPLAEPAPSVRIRRATENGIEYVVRYRLIPREVSPQAGRHTVNAAIIRHLRDAGIELAYPRRRIERAADTLDPPQNDDR